MSKIVVSPVIMVLIVTLNYLAPVYADSSQVKNEQTGSSIPFKKESDVSEDTAVNAFVSIILLLLISGLGVFYLKKKGFKGVYGMKSSNEVSVLSVNRISRKTTLYKVKVNDREIDFLESSDNVLLLADQEVK